MGLKYNACNLKFSVFMWKHGMESDSRVLIFLTVWFQRVTYGEKSKEKMQKDAWWLYFKKEKDSGAPWWMSFTFLSQFLTASVLASFNHRTALNSSDSITGLILSYLDKTFSGDWQVSDRDAQAWWQGLDAIGTFSVWWDLV